MQSIRKIKSTPLVLFSIFLKHTGELNPQQVKRGFYITDLNEKIRNDKMLSAKIKLGET